MNTPDVRQILSRYPNANRDDLIPILQDVQDACGFLSREVVVEISNHLRLPSSKIYGVATFYNQFRFHARGKYHVQVCRGTACHVKGSARILDMVIKLLNIKPGQTTRDKVFSLEVVACMGACGLSPVVNVNGEFYAKVTPKKLARILEECRNREMADTVEMELAHAEK